MNQDEIIREVNSYFADKPEMRLIVLYGSVAGQSFSLQSDVDIAVAGDEIFPFEKMLEMNAELQMRLHRDIDLVDLLRVKGLIHYKIVTKGLAIRDSKGLLAEHRIRALGFYEDMLPQLNEMRRRRIERVVDGS